MLKKMSLELAKEAFASRNYSLAVEIYERCLKERLPNFELYYAYGEALAKAGRLKESINAYTYCVQLTSAPVDKLRQLSVALIDSVKNSQQFEDNFLCMVCDGVFNEPVTLICGHSFCKSCIASREYICYNCGYRQTEELETDVLIRNLVEKWWFPELEAARILNEVLVKMDSISLNLDEALFKCNEALEHAPSYAPVLVQRSLILILLHQYQSGLTDAETVIRLRPTWPKGYYCKGRACAELGLTEDALINYCVGASLDKDPLHAKKDIVRLLHRLLLPKLRSRCTSMVLTSPYSNVFIRKQRFMTRASDPGVYQTDYEDFACGDDNGYVHSLSRRISTTYNYKLKLKDNNKMHSLLDKIHQEVEKIQRCEPRSSLIVPSHLLEQSDFDCVLCCRTLYRPVVTPCGHTYCCVCLDRALDYSSSCPLCISPLNNYLSMGSRNATQFVEAAMRKLIPGVYLNREIIEAQEMEELESEPYVPVFVCTTAYPGVPCPLFIYEPRYRLMVRRCIESGIKKFAIASCLDDKSGRRKFAEYGTLLEIRDCVLLNDGCSILTTVGSRRYRTLKRSEKDGYDTAEIEYIRDQIISHDKVEEIMNLHDKVRRKALTWFYRMAQNLKTEIIRSFGQVPDIEDNWITSTDGPAWSWWIVAILPLGPQLQVGILATTSLEKRLRAINKTLDHIQQRSEHQLTSSMDSTPGRSQGHHDSHNAAASGGELWRRTSQSSSTLTSCQNQDIVDTISTR